MKRFFTSRNKSKGYKPTRSRGSSKSFRFPLYGLLGRGGGSRGSRVFRPLGGSFGLLFVRFGVVFFVGLALLLALTYLGVAWGNTVNSESGYDIVKVIGFDTMNELVTLETGTQKYRDLAFILGNKVIYSVNNKVLLLPFRFSPQYAILFGPLFLGLLNLFSVPIIEEILITDRARKLYRVSGLVLITMVIWLTFVLGYILLF